MPLLRSANLVVRWEGPQLVLEDFVRRRRVTATPDVIRVLDLFSRPRSARAAARCLPPFTPSSVEREIRKLVRLGFLAAPSDRTAARGVAAAWANSFSAAHYHFATRNVRFVRDRREWMRALGRRPEGGNRPDPFKTYSKAPRIPLPWLALEQADVGLGRSLLARRTVRRFSTQDVRQESLARIVQGTWGQTGWLDAGILGRLPAKTSPSAGARHPIECYVIAWKVRGLRPGLYHYEVRSSSLERLRSGDFRREAAMMAGGQAWVGQAAFLCIMTAVTDRVFWKYASADAYRLFFLDAGHLAQTFVLLATAAGLGAFTTAAMSERRIEKALAIDGIHEFPVYLCGAGVPRQPPPISVSGWPSS